MINEPKRAAELSGIAPRARQAISQKIVRLDIMSRASSAVGHPSTNLARRFDDLRKAAQEVCQREPEK